MSKQPRRTGPGTGRVDHAARPTPENTPVPITVDPLAEEAPRAPEDQAVAEKEIAKAEAREPDGVKYCADCGSRSIAVTTSGVDAEQKSYCEKCRPANLRP